MKLQLMSDLHITHWGARMGVNWFQRDFVEQTHTDADVLVLAGDIVDLKHRDWRWSMARLQEFVARYKHVVYVPGNHEFYGTSISEIDPSEVEQQTGVYFLRPGRVMRILGRTFHGGVMFQPTPREELGEEPNPISDHWCIDDFKTEAPYQYQALREHLENNLREGDIVVTHHAPSNGSLAPEWVGDPCNHWFITHQMHELIERKKPAFWFHGHVHTPFDYQIGPTRVVCNPMGYPGEGVRFNPKLVLEIE